MFYRGGFTNDLLRWQVLSLLGNKTLLRNKINKLAFPRLFYIAFACITEIR